VSHLRPVDGDGTGGQAPMIDAELRAAVASYAVREGIDRLAAHFYAFAALAATVAVAYVAGGLLAALVATVLLGVLTAITVNGL
jgi:hypothetical protein